MYRVCLCQIVNIATTGINLVKNFGGHAVNTALEMGSVTICTMGENVEKVVPKNENMQNGAWAL